MNRPTSAAGLAYALAAYLMWGLVPLFWKQLLHIPAAELVSHRIVWSLVFVLAVLAWQKRMPELKGVLRDRRRVLWLAGSTALISLNWGLYIWAVLDGRITEGSLGYYINPLVNVILGRVFLGETLRPAQLVSVGLAGVGVTWLAVQGDHFPWVAIALALSFGLYGLLRKQAPVRPLPGLAVETLIAVPVAAFILGTRGVEGTWAFSISTPLQVAFVFAGGAVTALPLLWFAHAAQRLKYSTLGIIQYLSPTIQLLLAVLVYGEPFTRAHAVTFICIWAGVAVYAIDAVVAQRRLMKQVPLAV